MTLISTVVRGQDVFNGKSYDIEYTLVDTVPHRESVRFSEAIFFTSTLTKEYFKPYKVRITTTNTDVTFSLLTTETISNGTKSWAIISGHPDQLYEIRETTHIEDNGEERVVYYYFAYYPVRSSLRNKPMSGKVLIMSNRKLQ